MPSVPPLRATTESRRCSRCGHDRPVSEFVWRGRNCAACRATPPPSIARPRTCYACVTVKPWAAFEPRARVCRDCHAERQRIAQAKRRPKTKAGYRTCCDCHELKPLTVAHFYRDTYRSKREGRVEFMRNCRACHIRRVNERAKRKREADPEGRRAKEAEWQREWRARNPERSREYKRRHYARVRKDPVRWQARLEANRMFYRLRAEREGRSLAEITARLTSDRERLFGFVPVAPLIPLVSAYVAAYARESDGGRDEAAALADLGLTSRRWWAWRTEEATQTHLELADAVLTGLGLNPWDVWEGDDLKVWGVDLAPAV